MSHSQPTLSLCMIVRDAERSLGQALASARPYVDEMVIVETGSRDGTRDLVRQFGAQLFEFVWCDDFSAARNYSLEQATGDWILWIDADDVLPPESGAELRRRMAGCPGRDAAFWATVEETAPPRPGRPPRVMGHAHVKLFPRHPSLRFQYRIHEQIAPAIRALGLPIRQTPAVIQHAHADRSPEAEQARATRNLRLAYLDLQERPRDPFVWLSLGTTYLFLPAGLPSAIYFLQRSVSGFRSGSETQLNAYLYLGQALGTSGDRRQEENVYREALQRFPDDASLLMRLGHLCQRSRRLNEAATHYQTILERGRTRASAVHVRGSQTGAALQLGKLYLRMGQRERAERLWGDFLAAHPQAAPVREALSQSYLDPRSIDVGPRP
jgi:hypothetical protein